MKRPSKGEAPSPASAVPESRTVELWVDPGILSAYVTGLEKRLYVSNEAAARELGVLNVVNAVGIADIKEKLKAPRGLVSFEVKVNG